MRMNFNLKRGASVLMLSAAVCAVSAQQVFQGYQNSSTVSFEKVNLRSDFSNLKVNSVEEAVLTPAMFKKSMTLNKAGESTLRYGRPDGVYCVVPEGMFQPGVFPEAGIFMPLLTEFTFVNKSTADFKEFSWEYAYYQGATETSTEKDLTFDIPVPLGDKMTASVQTPTLMSGDKDFYYGENLYSDLQSIISTMNPSEKFYYYSADKTKPREFAFGYNTERQYTSIGTKFSQPANPMVITSVVIPFYIPEGETLPLKGKLTVWGVEEGKLKELFTSEELTADEYANILYQFKTPLLVNTEFYVFFEPNEFEKQPSWALINQGAEKVGEEQLNEEAALLFTCAKDLGVEGWTPSTMFKNPYNPAIFVEVVSPVVYPVLPDNNGNPAPMGIKELFLNGMDAVELDLPVFAFGLDITKVESDDETALTVSDLKLADAQNKIYSFHVKVTAADKYRKNGITLTTSLGTTWKMYLTQGGDAASISAVESSASVTAAFNGAAFEVSYPEGVNAVQVINVAGQVVAEYSLNGTSATIPATAMANGMYVLKFNNGSVVKVMR